MILYNIIVRLPDTKTLSPVYSMQGIAREDDLTLAASTAEQYVTVDPTITQQVLLLPVGRRRERFT